MFSEFAGTVVGEVGLVESFLLEVSPRGDAGTVLRSGIARLELRSSLWVLVLGALANVSNSVYDPANPSSVGRKETMWQLEG